MLTDHVGVAEQVDQGPKAKSHMTHVRITLRSASI
jgi:hypothetical protein